MSLQLVEGWLNPPLRDSRDVERFLREVPLWPKWIQSSPSVGDGYCYTQTDDEIFVCLGAWGGRCQWISCIAREELISSRGSQAWEPLLPQLGYDPSIDEAATRLPELLMERVL